MKLLSTMAAIRLDEDGDNIENTLSLALVDTARPGTTDKSIQSFDPLASSSWERVRKLCAMFNAVIFVCPSNPLFLSLSVTSFQHEPYVLLSKCHLHKQVPEEKTLITPVQCKSLWRQFKAETEYTVTQAIAAQVSC